MDYSVLREYEIFKGAEDIENTLERLKAYSRKYGKGEVIYSVGENVSYMGLALSGGVNIESDDIWGNRSILGHIGKGGIFAETYACLPNESLLVSVRATEDTEILFINAERLIDISADNGALTRNLLRITAAKNLSLSRRILHSTPKTIRGKLTSYFSQQVMQNDSYEFTIPFNRQQLADYLSVDRSALSNELSKMRKEGFLEYRKNKFKLLPKRKR